MTWSVAPPLDLASSRSRRAGASGAEACVKGPGASSSCISDALLVAPPFPWLRPPILANLRRPTGTRHSRVYVPAHLGPVRHARPEQLAVEPDIEHRVRRLHGQVEDAGAFDGRSDALASRIVDVLDEHRVEDDSRDAGPGRGELA